MTTQHDERSISGPVKTSGAPVRSAPPPGQSQPIARACEPLLRRMFGGRIPVRFVFWDHSECGPRDSVGSVVVQSPRALSTVIWSPNEVGLARAFIVGDIDFEGSLYDVLRVMRAQFTRDRRLTSMDVARVIGLASRLRVMSRPLTPPPEEVRLSGVRHSKHRDRAAVTHHYDVGNDFYELVLGPSMTYSCAFFADGAMTLEAAQTAKHDLICRKLGLMDHRGARLLDVGCGWGSMALHAAMRYDAEVLAVTLSSAQADYARARVEAAGLADQVEVRIQDYRDIRGESFDAISSVGMFEHVGSRRMDEYFETLTRLLKPHGRLLNHAISTVGSSRMHGPTFINRYVFPDGELIDVARVVDAMERHGLEVRDVESLREHYATTLRHWVDNLDRRWDDAIALVGARRARVWKLYMAASANGFEQGKLAIHQVLGVRSGADGTSAMPASRDCWRVA